MALVRSLYCRLIGRLPRLLVDGSMVLLYLLLTRACLLRFHTSRELFDLLPAAMNALMLALFVLRREARSFTRAPLSWLLASAGTVTPLLLRPAALASVTAGAGLALEAMGLLAAIAALLSLRRSWGIVPANRGVQVGGLYRWMRHPLYTAELTFVAGYALQYPSWANLAILAAEVGLQAMRAMHEERFLATDACYSAYMAQVRHRFVPGII